MLNLKKKALFGLSVSLVLAMAAGSFAIGDNQTPATPQVAATDNGETLALDVEGGTAGTDYDYVNGVLSIHPQSSDINFVIKNKDPGTETQDRIEITAGPNDTEKTVNITLNGVNINIFDEDFDVDMGAALKIADNAEFNVNITLADNSKNYMTSDVYHAGLEKNDDKTTEADIAKLGTLTIGAPSDSTAKNGMLKATGGFISAGIGGKQYMNSSNITITGGEIIATGGNGGAGIGGGRGGNGTDITIAGGIVKAFGGYDKNNKYPGAGIGGGSEVYGPVGKASDNHLSGNAVVFAVSGGEYADGRKKEALQGFDSASKGSIADCITFTGVGDYEYNSDYDIWELTGINWDESGKMYGDVTLSQNVEMTSNLTIPEGQTLSIDKDKEVKISGAKLMVEGELKNNGTLTLPNELEVKDSGKITTLLNYDLQGGSIKTNDDNYITYQDANGTKKYENLPEATKEGYDLEGWHTEKTGKKDTKVEPTDNVLLNQHTLYANWTNDPEPTPTPPGPEPGPEPEPTPDPSVNPDGDGSGSDASSKTSDPFMGCVALALLGVATTGAILTRKLR